MNDIPIKSGPMTNGSAAATAADGLHHIVVVGGGAGGLELVTRLGDKLGGRGRARVSLIERSRTHLWKPLLHEIAAGSMDLEKHAIDYLAQSHWHNFRFRFGEMTGLDRANRTVHVAATYDEDKNLITPERSFSYDTLVMSVGGHTNDFGTPGARKYALSLDTPEDAARFNRRLVNACLRAHTQTDAVRPEQLHVAIIGAGATGVELAAELHRTTRTVVAYGLDKIDPTKDLRITLIEAAPRILPALPERLSHSAEELLRGLDVDVLTGAKVTEVCADGVVLEGGRKVGAELVVWAAGVKAPDFLAEIDGLETNRANQLVVTPTLQTTRDPNIFAMGDCASAPWIGKTGNVPPRAQAAHQQASFLFRQLIRRINGKPLSEFHYRDFGSLVSLGEYSTVGSLMGKLVGGSMMIEGYFARMMYLSLYKMHERALHGTSKVALSSLSRALVRRSEPHVKLH
jgi:NADH dehydrogenase